MHIAVIGSGKIGSTLGLAWHRAGHRVTFGVRPGSEVRAVAAIGNSQIDSCERAVTRSHVVLMAVPGDVMESVLSILGPVLADRVVIDATNRLDSFPMNSLATCARLAPDAVVFRAFNSLGWEVFAEPRFSNVAADHFYCGPNGPHEGSVVRLITDLGLRPIRIGGLDEAEILDSWTRIYFMLAKGQGYGRHIAFRFLTDSGALSVHDAGSPSTRRDGPRASPFLPDTLANVEELGDDSHVDL